MNTGEWHTNTERPVRRSWAVIDLGPEHQNHSDRYHIAQCDNNYHNSDLEWLYYVRGDFYLNRTSINDVYAWMELK